jgi:hypothetical protein
VRPASAGLCGTRIRTLILHPARSASDASPGQRSLDPGRRDLALNQGRADLRRPDPTDAHRPDSRRCTSPSRCVVHDSPRRTTPLTVRLMASIRPMLAVAANSRPAICAVTFGATRGLPDTQPCARWRRADPVRVVRCPRRPRRALDGVRRRSRRPRSAMDGVRRRPRRPRSAMDGDGRRQAASAIGDGRRLAVSAVSAATAATAIGDGRRLAVSAATAKGAMPRQAVSAATAIGAGRRQAVFAATAIGAGPRQAVSAATAIGAGRRRAVSAALRVRGPARCVVQLSRCQTPAMVDATVRGPLAARARRGPRGGRARLATDGQHVTSTAGRDGGRLTSDLNGSTMISGTGRF